MSGQGGRGLLAAGGRSLRFLPEAAEALEGTTLRLLTRPGRQHSDCQVAAGGWQPAGGGLKGGGRINEKSSQLVAQHTGLRHICANTYVVH